MNGNIIRKNEKNRKRFHKVIEDFFNWSDLRWPLTNELWEEEFQPQSELTEDETNYYVKMLLPGISKKEVKIEMIENVLRIHGERKEIKKQDNARQHYSEISYGTFTREFILPNSIEKEKIKAHYEDGILSITVPKSAQTRPHMINIE